MTENRSPQCLFFPDIFPKRVVAQFDQRQGSSDGGAILLKAADRGLQLTEALAACLKDTRQPGKVDHESEELLGQCIFGMACGYADANDAARLAEDPVHKMLIGRDPIEGQDLASQPTICRFENAPDRKQLYRMAKRWPIVRSSTIATGCMAAPSSSPWTSMSRMIPRTARNS